jgi:antitoxin VapB
MKTAKIFINGKSQAVRLPKRFRFNEKEVSITPLGRGLIIQPIHKTWEEIFTKFISIPNNTFLSDREDLPPQKRQSLK